MNATTGWRATLRRAGDNAFMTRRSQAEEDLDELPPPPGGTGGCGLHPVQARNAHPRRYPSPQRPTQIRRAAPPPHILQPLNLGQPERPIY